MYKLILLTTCIFSLTSSISLCNNLIITKKDYIVKANSLFDKQNLDACIDNLYIFNHYCTLEKDSSQISQIWFEIACLNLLKSRFSLARTDLFKSIQYSISNILIRKSIFEILYSFKKKNYTNALQTFKKTRIPQFRINHLASLISIYIAHANDEIKKTSDTKNCSELELLKLKKTNDTLWFGYPLTKYYSGYSYFIKNQFVQSKTRLNEAIINFEKKGVLNNEWILSYYYILNNFNMLDDKNSSELYYSRFEQLKTKCYYNPENEYLFDKIKANHYYHNLNYGDEYVVLLKIYQNFLWDSTIRINTLKDLLLNQVMQYNYQLAIKYYELLPEKSRSSFDDVLAGRSYFNEKKYLKAKCLMNKCVEQLNPYDIYYSSILYDLSKYYSSLGEFDNEKKILLLNLSYVLKTFSSLNFHVYEIYNQLGYFYWGQEDFENALISYHKASYSLINTRYNQDVFCIPDISKSIDNYRLELALLYKAEVFYRLSKSFTIKEENLKYLKISLSFFELSIEVMHKNKSAIPLDEQKMLYADLYKRRYPNIIKVCLELFKMTQDNIYSEKAFEYAEKSKASLLLSLIKGIQIQKMNILPNVLIEKENQLRNREALLCDNLINAYKQKVPDYSFIDNILNKKHKLELSKDSLKELIKIKYPIYYATKNTEQVTTSKILQSKLSNNEAVIQYSLTYDFLVIYVLTRNTFKIFTDTIKAQFFNDISHFQKLNSNFSFNDIHYHSILSYSQLSKQLYDRLIKPTEPYIKNKKLIIIPDDVLNQIPFETLISEIPSNPNISFGKLHYLIRDHSISYNFSGTLYGINYQPVIVKNAKTLAVAPHYSDFHFSTSATNDKVTHGFGLSTIKGTSYEVKSIKASFPRANVIEYHATEKKFRDIAPSFDIIHLAMHGVINNESPMFSKLIFEPTKDSINEGFLNTYELYSMHLNSSMVVLSACNSGSGKLHSGEGIISLARGFFSAGAKSIVMTLWSVADKSSSKLMALFYSNLAGSKNIGDSMQAAKLEYLEQADNMSSHPYFWSGYIATGNTNIVFQPQQSLSWTYYIIATIIILTGVWFFRKEKLFASMIHFSRQ